MHNNKVIILSGYARGGTNIAWNILQSHPDICAPVYETGELFKRSLSLRVCSLLASQFDICKKNIDTSLYKAKLATLEHQDNKYISEGILYTKKQVSSAALNLKSVNNDIFLTDRLLHVYPDLYFIALARNGYALCDGYLRRGGTAADAGRLYRRIAEKMKRYSDSIPHFKMIKFEDVLQHPFEIAERLYTFLGASPVTVDKLRLKSKKVINAQGEHATAYGSENRKYWFDRSSIGQIISPNVNQTQMDRLTDEAVDEFNHEAESALNFFGYDIYR